MAKLKITTIWLVNGEKHDPVKVNRTIEKSDLNKYRRRIEKLILAKTGQKKAVMFETIETQQP